MKKLLVLTNAYPSKEKRYAGIFVKNQVAWLRTNSDLDVSVFAIKRSFTGTFGSIKKYLIGFLRFFRQLKENYAILHLHFLSPLLILPYIYKIVHPGTTVFLTMHGSDIHKLENKLLIRLYRSLISCVDEIVCVGKSMEEVVKEKLNREVDHFLCAGINTGAIYPLNTSYSERDIDFLYVGSFYEVKGTDKLVKAFQKGVNNKMSIVFIGSGDYEEEIMQLKDEKNLEICNGLSQKKINEYYNRSKFFIFPSRSEGFGLSLAEAMYCGTPAIISNLEQLKYQVQNNENGYVCKRTTAEELSKLIAKAHKTKADKWQRLSKNAMLSSLDYTIESVGESLKELYTNTLK
jgi:glycosyltransferase involved in cell wall biosynthesis